MVTRKARAKTPTREEKVMGVKYDRDVVTRFKQLEKEKLIKVNWDTGEFTLLGDEEKQKKTLNKFMYMNPKVCLQMMKQLWGEK